MRFDKTTSACPRLPTSKSLTQVRFDNDVKKIGAHLSPAPDVEVSFHIGDWIMRFDENDDHLSPTLDDGASYLDMNMLLPTFRVLAVRVRLRIEAIVVCHVTLFDRDEPEPAHDRRCRARAFHAEGRA